MFPHTPQLVQGAKPALQVHPVATSDPFQGASIQELLSLTNLDVRHSMCPSHYFLLGTAYSSRGLTPHCNDERCEAWPLQLTPLPEPSKYVKEFPVGRFFKTISLPTLGVQVQSTRPQNSRGKQLHGSCCSHRRQSP